MAPMGYSESLTKRAITPESPTATTFEELRVTGSHARISFV
jgi:hypothetical protein